MVPAMETLARGLRGAARIGAVDCSAHQGLCQRYGVQGYPTLKLLGPGGAQDYNGPRTAKAMRNALVDLIPDAGVRIANGGKPAAISSLKKRHCTKNACVVVLSSHSEPSALFKALAAYAKDDKAVTGLKYIHVDVGSEKQHLDAVLAEFGTPAAKNPLLLFVKADTARTFSSDKAGFTQIHKWIREQAK